MPASKSSSTAASAGTSKSTGGGSKATGAAAKAGATKPTAGISSRAAGTRSFVEQLVSHVINPLGLVLLTRERIQDTLDEAAAHGRMTRSDANELTAELVRRGRLQTDELLADAERLIERGREQFDSAAVRSRFSDGMDRIVRTADRARRTVGVAPSFPILGYDELTAAQVNSRLKGLSPTELRRVREYERRHANRKSVLDAIERALP
jgi:polyhydroxyalkanoate synthesis regulator phasin